MTPTAAQGAQPPFSRDGTTTRDHPPSNIPRDGHNDTDVKQLDDHDDWEAAVYGERYSVPESDDQNFSTGSARSVDPYMKEGYPFGAVSRKSYRMSVPDYYENRFPPGIATAPRVDNFDQF